tara:strand:+ start:2685 stop:4757 length:2073 start_codon:yes stop_codon:yes gene_type:complete
MVKKVFTIDTLPGVQRDGTIFDMNFYTDALWVRFQRGRPRKIGGYRAITTDANGCSRGIFVNSVDGNNQVFNGYNNGLEVLNIDNNGIGSGINQIDFGSSILTLGVITGGTVYTNGTYTTVPLTGGSGTGALATIVVAGNSVTTVTVTTVGSNYEVGDVLSATAASIGGTGSGFSVPVATINGEFIPNDLNLWQFDSMFDSQGSGNQLLLAHAGQNLAEIDAIVNTVVFAGDISGTQMSPLTDTSGTAPTGDVIEVSGGVVVLHPYVFVYGDNGLIKNCTAGDPFNWNGADANETNVSSTKIVKGLPVRGGSNAPSGLFWALDSLIRVSYTPTTVTVSGSPQTFYWRYDIISSQSSILSSQCVIEYDGIYYWIGVDRFLLYNGVVKEIKNTYNQNFFFDNLNYDQRQKVYANKVPRFGEIWWFYPSGDSEECNNAIIYNVREDVWYDAGFALGSYRTAGYFSQVFRYPINAGATKSVLTEVFATTATTVNGSANIEIPIINLVLLGQQVIGAGITDISVVIAIAPSVTPGYFTITLDSPATASATVPVTFNTTAGRVTLWQHEIGTDEVVFESSNAIDSFFQTSDLGFVAGNPAQTSPVGDNFWVNLERVEPDFIQQGEMTFQVTGRPYAQSTDVASQEYPFDPDTGKIDMRQQRREIRLLFRSNVSGGDYEMGKVLLSVTLGDSRPYGS